MKSPGLGSILKDQKYRRSSLRSYFPTASLFCIVLFLGGIIIAQHGKEKLLKWKFEENFQSSITCEGQCRPPGSEALPKGIVAMTSNLERRPLWGLPKQEGLEISQPALDRSESEVHHQITARGMRSTVHRRTYKPGDNGTGCDYKSSGPPCTGWIEVMAPVFSRAAWRCVWYMIQNDLIHAWGLDMQLGYCAQGDRTKKIGVVDAEYIVHYGIPTLGEPKNKTKLAASQSTSNLKNLNSLERHASPPSKLFDYRIEVRRQSYREYKVFRKRWKKAVQEDECWTDPYPEPINDTTI